MNWIRVCVCGAVVLRKKINFFILPIRCPKCNKIIRGY